MGIKTYRPVTPSRRFLTGSDFADLTEKKPTVKSLLKGKTGKGGRNNFGRVTVRWRSGGHKRKYRLIDFKRNKINIPAKVETIEYDPNRSSRIALLSYNDGEKNYIVAPVSLKVGDVVISSESEVEIKPGNSTLLKSIPVGTIVHNIELHPKGGSQLARSAGSFVQIMAKEGRYVLLKLPSGELRKVLEDCRATIGQVGNTEHENMTIGKAGRKRWMGKKGHVSGNAMNPVDHPHGGGEGHAAGGRPSVTPWGKPTKGHKTRHNKSTNKYIVKRRKTKNA